MSTAPLKRLWTRTMQWRAVARQRQQLRTLDDLLLKDIGISRADAIHEADRHFWDSAATCDSSLKICRSSSSEMKNNSETYVCCPQ